MNLDKQMKKYKEKRKVNPREEKIQETIEVARKAFFLLKQKKTCHMVLFYIYSFD